MILGILFVACGYLLSKFTAPPKHETWEEIENQSK